MGIRINDQGWEDQHEENECKLYEMGIGIHDPKQNLYINGN